MAWIEVHQSLRDHRKLLALSESLKIRPVYAMGHLISLWLWALDNAPSGDLAEISDKAIAKACQWQGKTELLLSGLKNCHWLDGKVLHDWQHYAGKLIQAREKDRLRKRLSGGTPPEIRQNSEDTVPNHTVPIKEINKEKTSGEPQKQSSEVPNVFKCYEQNIGILTPMVAEQIKSLLEDYSEEKINGAIQEAVKSNARSLRYITKVLENRGNGHKPQQRHDGRFLGPEQ